MPRDIILIWMVKFDEPPVIHKICQGFLCQKFVLYSTIQRVILNWSIFTKISCQRLEEFYHYYDTFSYYENVFLKITDDFQNLCELRITQ